MVQRSNRQQPSETRTFVKKVGGETLTREVTSPQAEVLARFDGFTEKASSSKPASSGSGSSSTAGSST